RGGVEFAALHRVIQHLAPILQLLRRSSLRHQYVEIVRRGGQGFVAGFHRLGIVAGGGIGLGQLPIAVGYGLRVGSKLLHEVLQQGDALLRIGLAADGLQRLVLRRAGGNNDFFQLRVGEGHEQNGDQQGRPANANHFSPPQMPVPGSGRTRLRKARPLACPQYLQRAMLAPFPPGGNSFRCEPQSPQRARWPKWMEESRAVALCVILGRKLGRSAAGPSRGGAEREALRWIRRAAPSAPLPAAATSIAPAAL